MTRYYKKYLPYIIFFSTILVGTATILTASQLQNRSAVEEPVVSTESEAFFSNETVRVCDLLEFTMTDESTCENQVERYRGVCEGPGTTAPNPVSEYSTNYKIKNIHKVGPGVVDGKQYGRLYYTIELNYEEMSFHCDEKWGQNHGTSYCQICESNKNVDSQTVTLESGEESTGTISRSNDGEACGTFQNDIAIKSAYLSIWDDEGKVWLKGGNSGVARQALQTEGCENWGTTTGIMDIIQGAICRTGIECGVPQPACGDGNVDAGEQCDDGNTKNGDGCSSTCQTETPPPPPPPPTPACGDGNVDVGEQCDDGNTKNGDGCSSTCQTETPPPPPTPLCGDGTKNGTEECDPTDLNDQNKNVCTQDCYINHEPVCENLSKYTSASPDSNGKYQSSSEFTFECKGHDYDTGDRIVAFEFKVIDKSDSSAIFDVACSRNAVKTCSVDENNICGNVSCSELSEIKESGLTKYKQSINGYLFPQNGEYRVLSRVKDSRGVWSVYQQ